MSVVALASLEGAAACLTQPYEVSAEKLREFSAAVTRPGDPDALARAVATPTFAVVVSQRSEGRLLAAAKVELSRVIHGEQSFVHHRSLRPGDVVSARSEVTRVRAIAGNTMVTTRTNLTDAEDAEICTATSLLVIRGEESAPVAQAPATAIQSGTQAPLRSHWTSHRSPHGAELTVGEIVASGDYLIQRADLIRYAGASGDFNPVHWNERIATEVGLPGVIAHGMLTMATAGRLVTDWVGCETAVLSLDTKFTKPVVVPDPGAAVVHIDAKVGQISPAERTVRLDLTVTCDGVSVLGRARATVRLP